MDVGSKRLEDTSNIPLGIFESRVPSMKQCTPRGARKRKAVGHLHLLPYWKGERMPFLSNCVLEKIDQGMFYLSKLLPSKCHKTFELVISYLTCV